MNSHATQPGASIRAPLPVETNEARQLSVEEARKYLQHLRTPLGPPPPVQDAFAAITSCADSSKMGDRVRDYIRAVALLPIDEQPAARQRLKEYFASTRNAR